METRKGQIKYIEEKKCSNGSFMFTFQMEDGNRYNTFDEKIGKNFHSGDNVELEGQMEGKYWNMKSMKLSEAKPEVQKCSTDRDKSIIAQVLTKCYAEMSIANKEADKNLLRKELLETYTFFLENQK